MNPQRMQWLGIVNSLVIFGVLAFVVVKVAPVPLAFSVRQPVVIAVYAVAVIFYFMAFLGTRHSPPIVRLMMLEAIAILGLVASYLVHDARVYLGPGVLALIGIIRSFPRDEAR